LNGLLEKNVYLDIIFNFFKVPGNGNLNDARVVLKIEEKLVEMNVQRPSSSLMVDQHLFDFTDAQHGALKYLLNIKSFLRMDHLIVALFKFGVNINVLDVEAAKMLSDFIFSPRKFDIRFSSLLVWLLRDHFDLLLLLKVVHGICPLKVVSNMRHTLISD
jgi:hypothetical protein